MDVQEARVKTYYEILGVPLDAPTQLIREMYKDLAKLYHPDSNYYADLIQQAPSDEQVELFKIITTAYQTLVDPNKRLVYDDKVRPLLTGTFKKWEDSEEDFMVVKTASRERKNTFGTMADKTALAEIRAQKDTFQGLQRIKVKRKKKHSLKPILIIAIIAALGALSFVAYTTTKNAPVPAITADKVIKKNF